MGSGRQKKVIPMEIQVGEVGIFLLTMETKKWKLLYKKGRKDGKVGSPIMNWHHC